MIGTLTGGLVPLTPFEYEATLWIEPGNRAEEQSGLHGVPARRLSNRRRWGWR